MQRVLFNSVSMPTVSFPIYSEKEFFDRKIILLKEFKVYGDDDMNIREFMYLSDAAIQSRKERLKAIEQGKMVFD